MIIEVPTQQKRQVIDITNPVQEQLVTGNGVVNIFVEHTTAAITTADLDPGTDLDFLDFLNGLVPDPPAGGWRHPHNPEHVPDHLLSSIIGPGVCIPVKGGRLLLGTWQRVVLVELDGPRRRNVEVTLISTS